MIYITRVIGTLVRQLNNIHRATTLSLYDLYNQSYWYIGETTLFDCY